MAPKGNPGSGDGVYKSIDGGDTWAHIGLTDTRNIYRIRVHPEDPDLVYVSVIGSPFGPSQDRGIFRSQDGGDTWVDLSERPGLPEGDRGRIGLAHSKHRPDRISALIDSKTENGLYQSEDGGKTWDNVSPDLPPDSDVYEIEASPHDAATAYIAVNGVGHDLPRCLACPRQAARGHCGPGQARNLQGQADRER